MPTAGQIIKLVCALAELTIHSLKKNNGVISLEMQKEENCTAVGNEGSLFSIISSLLMNMIPIESHQ